MISRVLLVIFMSFLSSLFGGENKNEPASSDGWAIAKVTSADGRVGVFRYREAKPTQWQSAPLSEEVSITWRYAGSLPDEATSAKMAGFEDAMESLSSDPDVSLVLVMTLGGSREWVYYCRDYDAYMRRLNACLAGKPRFPIGIEHSHDAEWKYWHSFVDRLERK